MKTRFSVLVPAYNRERLLAQTLDSVLGQTFKDYELIVIDDGSTDRTVEVIESYGDRVKALRQSNQGPEAARRMGAAVATGEYFVLLDSDDLLLPWALATYDRIIQELEAPALIIGSLIWFLDGQVPQPEAHRPDGIDILKYRDFLAKDVTIGMSSSNIVVRRSVFEETGASRSTFKTFPLDTHHYLLLFGSAGTCAVVKAPNTVAYRYHESNAIRNVEGMIQGIHRLVEAERRGLYPSGRSRRFDRYVCIGGISWFWIRKALRHGLFRLGFLTLIKCSPMVLAGMSKKSALLFRRPAHLLRLGKLSSLLVDWEPHRQSPGLSLPMKDEK